MSDKVRDPNSREAKLIACWKKYCRHGEDEAIPQKYLHGWIDGYETAQSLIDAKDAEIAQKAKQLNAMQGQNVELWKEVDLLRKDLATANSRIEVQRVNIEALQNRDNLYLDEVKV